MDLRYTNREDVSRRLDNSIVRYKNTFYYAKLDDDALNLKLYSLETGRPATTVDSNSLDLDISSPELGYCHCTGPEQAVFIRRAPYRRQKQGASNENLTYTFHKDNRIRQMTNDIMLNKYFKDMLDGTYKDYKDCLAYFNDEKNLTKTSCLAFSRDFAIGRVTPKQPNLTLFYQNVEIGEVLKGKVLYGATSLLPEYNNSIFIQYLARYGAMNA